ncbi:(d)CMP kinase [Devosia sp. MC521]|uniref:uridine kinase family protein n=1 Tax=Devosia sp. MC521 TaxID=2759954 RepID=UPI0015F9E6A8|nr:(d)CMP kinase [Devosia sp. MC521]MBJ6988906.1 (d)CMP kinase [Devosia sp. MC521]QMW62255.1 (d)CMP kinase [Devosia sp. MC521]
MVDTSLDHLVKHLTGRAQTHSQPLVLAIDGRSGVGKSTLATGLATRTNALLISGDDFYRGGVTLRHDSAKELTEDCIDWRAQRRILTTLRNRANAHYYSFDWAAFDGSLAATPVHLSPRPLIILEGVYSARPELSDLIDLALLVEASPPLRTKRLIAREGTIGPWERQWHRAEDWYFGQAAPSNRFDCIVASRPKSWLVLRPFPIDAA